MTSPHLDTLARTIAAVAPASTDAVLETAAHGTVVTRAEWRRREITRDLMSGEAPLLSAEVLASIPIGAAPGTDVGDLAWIHGKLWKVRSPLDGGAEMLVLQLAVAPGTPVEVGEDTVTVAVVGDPDGTAPVVALAPPGVLRRSDLVMVDGDRYRVGTPTDWPAERPVGSLRRYVLTPA